MTLVIVTLYQGLSTQPRTTAGGQPYHRVQDPGR